MTDILKSLDGLCRPRLLIRAARYGLQEYRRCAHLKRHLGYGHLPRSGPALMRLIEIESEVNTQRKNENASYSASYHVDLLIAMMGEAQLLRASLSAQPEGAI
ncbi:FIG01023066: hypothetical protein [hydrothermal vent metagenome]|uniref:Uncharacterized protein n=1 Tax=hydrothermal vent metagenome TaxID=652676 RepID=A0A3B0S3X8_9ZZZZ